MILGTGIHNSYIYRTTGFHIATLLYYSRLSWQYVRLDARGKTKNAWKTDMYVRKSHKRAPSICKIWKNKERWTGRVKSKNQTCDRPQKDVKLAANWIEPAWKVIEHQDEEASTTTNMKVLVTWKSHTTCSHEEQVSQREIKGLALTSKVLK